LVAAVFSPLIPIAWVSWQTSGGVWSAFVYLWGYLLFGVVGLPLALYAYTRRKFWICVICGAGAAIVPLLLLGSLSMFSTVQVNARAIIDWLALIVAGAVGGAAFWVISSWSVDMRR
jgi:hypothetical protein